MTYDGTRVWITGASSGIGAALATELVRRGARVAVSARSADRLATVAGGAVLAVPVDVTDRAAMVAAADLVRDELGGIDVAVFSAGVWEQVDVTRWDSGVFRRHLDVHVMGLVHGMEAVLPAMLERRSGTIVGVASVAGLRGLPKAEAYGSSKAAMIRLLESARADLTPRGIRVVTVVPGFVRTGLTADNSFPMPWMIEPADAARRMADTIAGTRSQTVFPLPMALAMGLASRLPQRVWDALAANVAARSG